MRKVPDLRSADRFSRSRRTRSRPMRPLVHVLSIHRAGAIPGPVGSRTAVARDDGSQASWSLRATLGVSDDPTPDLWSSASPRTKAESASHRVQRRQAGDPPRSPKARRTRLRPPRPSARNRRPASSGIGALPVPSPPARDAKKKLSRGVIFPSQACTFRFRSRLRRLQNNCLFYKDYFARGSFLPSSWRTRRPGGRPHP